LHNCSLGKVFIAYNKISPDGDEVDSDIDEGLAEGALGGSGGGDNAVSVTVAGVGQVSVPVLLPPPKFATLDTAPVSSTSTAAVGPGRLHIRTGASGSDSGEPSPLGSPFGGSTPYRPGPATPGTRGTVGTTATGMTDTTEGDGDGDWDDAEGAGGAEGAGAGAGGAGSRGRGVRRGRKFNPSVVAMSLEFG
jgi:hypothetical protein